MKTLNTFLVLVLLLVAFPLSSEAETIEDHIAEMTRAYSQSTNGVQDPVFLEKVNLIDQELATKLEKDNDIGPFKVLVKDALKLQERKGARMMFEFVLQKAQKRLSFTKAQGEIKDEAVLKEIEELTRAIEKYLDPNAPDNDTVDRAKLEKKRKDLLDAVKNKKSAISKIQPEKRLVVAVTDEAGQPTKISSSQEANLVAKVKGVVGEPAEMRLEISIKPKGLFNLHVLANDFFTPTGFSMLQGKLDFEGIPMKALDNTDAAALTEVLGDTYFRRYEVVQTEDQMNMMPHGGTTAFGLGSIMPGQVYRMEFAKTDGISAIIKELENGDQMKVLNAKTAVSEKVIEIKNVSEKNLVSIQGSDPAGICSVKGIGMFKVKTGKLSFSEILLVVDDQLASDLTRFIGENGINFFMGKAYEFQQKGLPFTPILENLTFDRAADGKQTFIFSGKGKFATQ